VSEDNKVKLLRIQQALLDALAEKKLQAPNEVVRKQIEEEISQNLSKYKELVTEVDYGIYKELEEKTKKVKNSKYSLEEELNELEEIETFYTRLVEVQSRFKQNYAIHSQEPLTLSNISNLNIDVFIKRKEAIKGYLANKKNITENKQKLEKISEQLIEEEQKEYRITKKIIFLEEELIRRILNSEGRLLIKENNQEVLKYTSIASEYKEIGITIEKNSYTGKSLLELENIFYETKEKLSAATISYEVMPTVEKKKIFDEIKNENDKAYYHLVLVKILEEVYKPCKTCNEAIQKRERIKDLINYRRKYLDILGIKHGIDPFTRIHINEQIEELKKYESNTRTIFKIRHELAELNSQIENLESDNINKLKTLEESTYDITNIQKNEEPVISFNDFTTEIRPADVRILDNQVVNIKELSPGFNYKKCKEITTSVIKKVYHLLTNQENIKPKERTPDIIIEQSPIIPEKKNVKITKDEELFSDSVPFIKDDSIKTQEPSIVTPDLSPEKITINVESDLFNDTTPFESVQLFTEKIDTKEEIEPIQDTYNLQEKIPVNQSQEEKLNLEENQVKENIEINNLTLSLDKSDESDEFNDFWPTVEEESQPKVLSIHH